MVSSWHKGPNRMSSLGCRQRPNSFPSKEECIPLLIEAIKGGEFLKPAARRLFGMSDKVPLYAELNRDPRILKALHERAVRLDHKNSPYRRLTFTAGA